MKITDEQRSMIASAFVAGYDYDISDVEAHRRSLCCASDAREACASIVGEDTADALRTFCYEELGCCGWRDPVVRADVERDLLEKISALDEL